MVELFDDYEYLCIYEAMEDFTHFDPVEIAMFEAGFNKDKKSEKLWDKNQSIMVNTTNLILKLIKKCKEMILNALDSVRNAVDYIFLKKEDKERYAEYEAFLKSHPAYRNKKVRVRDWKKIEKKYDDAIRHVEQMEVRAQREEISKEELQKEEHDIISDLTNLSATGMSVLTAEVALRTAKSSTENAKKVQKWLQLQGSLLNKMEDELGKKEVAKFEKKINQYTQETWFTKMKTKIYGMEQRTAMEVMADTLKEIGDIDTDGGKLSLVTKNLGWASKNKGLIKGAVKHGLIDKENREALARTAKTAGELKDKYDDIKHKTGLDKL